MKLFVLLMTILISQTFAISSYSQDKLLSLRLTDSTVKDALIEIEKSSEFYFLYSNLLVDVDRQINVDLNNKKIEEVLAGIFQGTETVFVINDRQIILKPDSKDADWLGMQQKRTVTGKVVDSSGQPLPGVTVLVKGTAQGTVTDFDGNYTIADIPPTGVLIFSFVGMRTQEIVVGNQVTVNVTMAEDAIGIEEVVAVGYGVQKKVNLTGAVEVIDAEEFENRPVTNASAMLQGKAAGLTFSTPSGGNTPGSTPTIQIRGQASLSGPTPPLVVIDGVPSEMAEFNALNPNDIESISVLKDAAAAAIYGARAPYGVMIVSTKMGKRNEAPSISYSGNFAFVDPVRTPNMVDSYTFALAKNQSMLNARRPAHFSEEKLDLILDNIQNPGKYELIDLIPGDGDYWGWGNNSYVNNDWFDIWFKPSFRHQHNLSLSGGSEKTSFFVSTGYVYQPGILEFIEDNDNYKRFNINGGVNTDVADWLKVTYRSKYSNEIKKDPSLDYNAGRDRIYQFAYGAWPVTPLKNPDGTYNEGNRIPQALGGGHRTDNVHRLNQSLAFDLNLAPGWTAHLDGSWRMTFQDYQNHRKPVMGKFPSGTEFQLGGTESSLYRVAAMTNYWTTQAYTAFEKSIKDHNFRLQMGGQVEEQTFRRLEGTAYDLFVWDVDAISIAQGTRTLDDVINDWATVGYFGRFNYNYAEKYLLEVNGRYDGSGRYMTGKRWGFFPSVSLGWNMSKEGFWESIEDVVNFAKIRGSYGTLGNQGNSSGYLHVPTMSVSAETPWIFDGQRLPYVNTPGILNIDRTWEKITSLDIGAELRVFDSRLIGEVNIFNRRSWDIIGPPTPVPNVLGQAAPSVNNAEFVTKGWELQLSWRDQITSRWDYNVGLTLSDARSEITKYNTTVNSINGWYVGKEMGEIWGFEVDRLLNQNDFNEDGNLKVSQSQINANWFSGDVKYEDLDGDKMISYGNSTVEDSGDRKIIGNSTPRYRIGLQVGTGFDLGKSGRIDVNAFFQGVLKRDVFLGGEFEYWGTGHGNSYMVSVFEGDHLDFYRDETSDPRLIEHLGLNKDAYWFRPYDGWEGRKNVQTNTRYLQSGAYMRMKSLQVSYTLPTSLLNKVKMRSCKVYFSGENLFVLSGLPSHLDPEYVSGGRMYPQQAVYSFGVNVGF